MSICTKKLKRKIYVFVTIIFGGHDVASPSIEFLKIGMSKEGLYSRVMGPYVK
jgi:hypothetical protein